MASRSSVFGLHDKSVSSYERRREKHNKGSWLPKFVLAAVLVAGVAAGFLLM